jgi:hypothetical protein
MERLKGKDHSEDPEIDGQIILKLILEKWVLGVWIAFIWRDVLNTSSIKGEE